jgi:O-antigen/teichoic acid export membrane protein
MPPDNGRNPEGFDLRGKVLHGLKWTAVVRVATQTISWIITILVIRFLRPEDYGLHAMISVSVYILLLLSTAGIEEAIIQARDLGREQIRKMFGVLLLVDLGLCVVQVAIAPLLAAFYRQPRMIPMLWVMAGAFLLIPFNCVPLALLGREIDFKHRSLADLAKAASASVLTLILAINGFGVWSLIFGQLIGMLCHTIVLNLFRPWLCWPVFSLKGIERSVAFGGMVMLTAIIWVVCARTDAFIGGRMLGPELLGIYAVGLHVASLPMEKIMPLLHQIAFPAYARVQRQTSEAARHFLKSVRLVSLVTVPLLLGLAAVAKWAVPLVLSERWRVAVLPVTLVSLVIPLRAIGTMYSPLLNAIGRTTVNMGNALISLVLLTPAFLVGAQWGVAGLCVAWLVVYPVIFLLMTSRVLRVLQLSMREFLVALAPPACAGVIMLLIVRAVGESLPTAMPSAAILAVLITLGAVLYMGLMWYLPGGRLQEAVELARSRSGP